MEERFLIRKEIEMIRKKAEWNEQIHCHYVSSPLNLHAHIPYREIEQLENRLKELEEENR